MCAVIMALRWSVTRRKSADCWSAMALRLGRALGPPRREADDVLNACGDGSSPAAGPATTPPFTFGPLGFGHGDRPASPRAPPAFCESASPAARRSPSTLIRGDFRATQLLRPTRASAVAFADGFRLAPKPRPSHTAREGDDATATASLRQLRCIARVHGTLSRGNLGSRCRAPSAAWQHELRARLCCAPGCVTSPESAPGVDAESAANARPVGLRLVRPSSRTP